MLFPKKTQKENENDSSSESMSIEEELKKRDAEISDMKKKLEMVEGRRNQEMFSNIVPQVEEDMDEAQLIETMKASPKEALKKVMRRTYQEEQAKQMAISAGAQVQIIQNNDPEFTHGSKKYQLAQEEYKKDPALMFRPDGILESYRRASERFKTESVPQLTDEEIQKYKAFKEYEEANKKASGSKIPAKGGSVGSKQSTDKSEEWFQTMLAATGEEDPRGG